MKKPLKPSEIKAKKKQEQLMEKAGADGRLSDQDAQDLRLTADLTCNRQLLEGFVAGSQDIVFREIILPTPIPKKALLIYVEGLADDKTIGNLIMRSLLVDGGSLHEGAQGPKAQFIDQLVDKLILIGEIKKENRLDSLLTSLLTGDTLLLLEQSDQAIVMDTRGWASRAIEDPSAESVIRGPREGFVETLRTNTALVRRKLRTSDLKIKMMQIGTRSKTDVAIVYIEGIANPKVVAEAEKRLERIEIDSVLESGYLEELIEDSPYSPFPQIQSTERPDKVVANLLEGRVAIMVDHTPFVLLIPTLFIQFIQATEDYYERSLAMSMLRIVRMLALVISIVLPGLYVAAITFHQEMIPFGLAMSIAAGREGTPLPGFLEVIFMGVVFEILREAGMRLPKPVGQAVSIVGALVIGDAAVNAGVVSPIMVIVAALTAISSFAIPSFSLLLSTSLLRLAITLAAAVLGYFGVIWMLLLVLIHLASLRSFGVPYLSPVAPANLLNLKDTVIRAPWWGMVNRPHLLTRGYPQRAKLGLKPEPSQGKGGRNK